MRRLPLAAADHKYTTHTNDAVVVWHGAWWRSRVNHNAIKTWAAAAERRDAVAPSLNFFVFFSFPEGTKSFKRR